MHKLSSINIKPVSGNSEKHNERTGKRLDYVRYDLTNQNVSWSIESLGNARKRIEETYRNSTGQKMQARSTPIREGVVNLGKSQDLNTIKNLCSDLEREFKIKAIQIHVHEDEGHHRVKSGEWKQNRHAHILFDWTDQHGKSIKLNKADMAKMQTIVADSLGMERGQSSNRKHKSAMAYKIEQMEKDIKNLSLEKIKLKYGLSKGDILLTRYFHPKFEKQPKNDLKNGLIERAKMILDVIEKEQEQKNTTPQSKKAKNKSREDEELER